MSMDLFRAILSADFSLFVAVAVCAIAGVLALAPLLRAKWAILVLSCLAAALIYRSRLPGYVFLNVATYSFVGVVSLLVPALPATQQARWRWSVAGMLLLLLIFCAGRYYELEARGWSWRGLNLFFFSLNMWAFLRLITFLWEFGSGRIRNLSLINFFLWIALPFALVGPILRYSQFEQQLSGLGEPKKGILSADFLRRFGLGTLHLLLGILLTAMQASILGPGSGLSRLQKLVFGFSVAPWSFYLLWAGYFKLMELLALFWGITLPASFNRPFGRRNLSEFWANWNMSATSVFRDYLFFNRWGLQKANVYVNTMIVFLMVGLWHGLNGYWILFGLMHGIGFCAYLWYSRNRSHIAVLRQNLVDAQFRYTGPIATYLYVCSCWFLPPQILKLIR
jgi:D-alanyl-lipoteichoic acid acyltransferase DltB (MBOAT superfamily)